VNDDQIKDESGSQTDYKAHLHRLSIE
jgi:hypothetical protein